MKNDKLRARNDVEGRASGSPFCAVPVRCWRIEKQTDTADGEPGQNQPHGNEAQLCPPGGAQVLRSLTGGLVRLKLSLIGRGSEWAGYTSEHCHSLSWHGNAGNILGILVQTRVCREGYKPRWMFHVGAFLLPNVVFGLVWIPWVWKNLCVGAQKLPSRKFSMTSVQNCCTVDLNVAFINTAVSRWDLLKMKHKVKKKVTFQLKGTKVWGNWKLTMATQNRQIKLFGFKSFKNPLIQKKEINPWKPSNKNCNYHCQ